MCGFDEISSFFIDYVYNVLDMVIGDKREDWGVSNMEVFDVVDWEFGVDDIVVDVFVDMSSFVGMEIGLWFF